MVGEFSNPGRLPSESSLAAEYHVSRVTIRTALKALESQGLVDIRHGSGTYLVDFGSSIRSGLQELRSITQIIADMGQEPSFVVHGRELRAATHDEAQRLGIPDGQEVWCLDRTFLADGRPVGYAIDVLPARFITPSVANSLGDISVFDTMNAVGIQLHRAIAELHAVTSDSVSWGDPEETDELFLLLDQVAFDVAGRRVALSRTAFPEGRFQFVILRTR